MSSPVLLPVDRPGMVIYLNGIWFSGGESDSFVAVVENRVVISEENFADVPHWLTIGEGHVVGVECRYAYS